MENQIIDEYKDAIGEMFYTVISERDFEKSENPFYCYKSITNFSTIIDEKLSKKEELKEMVELYKFNDALTDLLKELTMFFIAIYKYDGSDESYIGVSYVNVSQSFKNLERFDAFINEHVQLNHFDNVLLIKDYYSNIIGEVLLFLDNNLYLDIKKCSFKMDFDNLLLSFKNSISIEEINIREKVNNSRTKKISEKWFALLYWFELLSKRESPPIDSEGAFIKREIMAVGKVKCKSTGQSFYNNFKSIDINDERLLKMTFGSSWKEQIVKLSNNDEKIIAFLKHKYDN